MIYQVQTCDGYVFNVTTSEDGAIISNDSAGSFDWQDEAEFVGWVADQIRDEPGLISRFTSRDNQNLMQ